MRRARGNLTAVATLELADRILECFESYLDDRGSDDGREDEARLRIVEFRRRIVAEQTARAVCEREGDAT